MRENDLSVINNLKRWTKKMSSGESSSVFFLTGENLATLIMIEKLIGFEVGRYMSGFGNFFFYSSSAFREKCVIWFFEFFKSIERLATPDQHNVAEFLTHLKHYTTINQVCYRWKMSIFLYNIRLLKRICYVKYSWARPLAVLPLIFLSQSTQTFWHVLKVESFFVRKS